MRWPRDWSSDVCSSDLAITPSTALSILASSSTIKGACPPSSKESFVTFSALCSISLFPTSVEPVKRSEERRVGKEVRTKKVADMDKYRGKINKQTNE